MTRGLLLLTAAAALGCRAPHPPAPAPAPAAAPARPLGVVDMHVHVSFDAEQARGIHASRPPTPEAVRALLRDPAIDRLGAVVIAPRGAAATAALNDALLEFVRSDPRLFAIASVHPLDGDAALAEVTRLAGLGVHMIKLHQNTQRFDLDAPEVGAVVARAAEVGIAVMFEGSTTLDPKTIGKLVMLAASHPTARLVVAHMGFSEFRQTSVFVALREYPWWTNNVYFDCSATVPYYVDSPVEAELVWTIRALGVDRMMFGSDFPVYTPTDALDALTRLGLSDDELRAITSTTARELLQLAPAADPAAPGG